MATRVQTGATIKGKLQRAANASGSIAPTPPSNLAAPVVSGTGNVGDVLTSTTGVWTGTPPIIYTYQWQKNAVNISGATTNTYTPIAGDLGATIRCVVTATNAQGSASANSNGIVIQSLSAPVNTVAPAISPTGGIIGTLVTCTTGTWTGSPTPTYTYQWQRNTVDISGETNNTYTPVYPADNGVSLRCVVTATNSQGSASANSNAVTVQTYTAPSNTVAPAASPTGGIIGTQITVNNGTWTGTPTPTFTYQLQRNTVDVSGATSSSYTPVYPTDNGAAIRWRVIATNIVSAVSANSNSITIETYTAPANTVAPLISGTNTIGSTLSVSNGTWTGNPAPTFARQWRRNGSNIAGATSSTYLIIYPDDNGATLDCVVTATNAVTSTAQASSNSITVATVSAPANTSPPVLSPTSGLIGTQITCSTGVWSGNPVPTYTYQWQRSGVDISGQTANTFTPAYPADNSASIRCVVTATNFVGSASANSSAVTIETYTAPVNTVQPTVSGTGNVGSAITTNNGTWSGNPTPTYTYQARKNGSDISGQTASSYTPVTGDIGSVITYRVTATNPAGSASALTSNGITVVGGATVDEPLIIMLGTVNKYIIPALTSTSGLSDPYVTALGAITDGE